MVSILCKNAHDYGAPHPRHLFWMMGGLYYASWADARLMGLATLPVLVLLWLLGWKLNVLSLGDETARGLGLNPGRLRMAAVELATVAAVCVSVCSIVAWVGLMTPHAARVIFGPDHRWVVPGSAVIGAVYLLVCDTIARTLTRAEIPLGIVTSVVGPHICSGCSESRGGPSTAADSRPRAVRAAAAKKPYGTCDMTAPNLTETTADRSRRHTPPAAPPPSAWRDGGGRPGDYPADRQAGTGGKSDAVITVRGLNFSYGSRRVLRGVDLDVRAGELRGLLDPNGSGKSTLFKCCLGFLKTRPGAVRVGGRDLSSLSPGELAKRISHVPKEHGGGFPFTVREMVEMGRTPRVGAVPFLNAGDRLLVEASLERVGLARLAGENYNHLSGRRRQLVLVARAPGSCFWTSPPRRWTSATSCASGSWSGTSPPRARAQSSAPTTPTTSSGSATR
ncbi:MAG: iron chelate uptake ABC transporter family permease subunit [Deltaproteobacteria bacterium]|nr:iron chelate uptake ABC transporter family permease subunit [Deltaproteobacteria bacterium]